MATTDPQDTLAYHQSRVLTVQRDMRDVALSQVSKAVKKFAEADPNNTKPDSEALWFYGMNHVMALVSANRAPLEPLPKEELELVKTYHLLMGEKAVRAFYYLLIICTREARHNQSLQTSHPQMVAKFGQETADWFMQGGGEGDIYSRLLNKPPKTTVGNFVECVRWQFYNSSWNGGYGGKAWGAVTDCLARFVNGEFSAEMMLDTIWTLCHNNGPIFNKGMLYSHHSPKLVRVLDLQRSGQIPEAVLSDPHCQSYAAPGLIDLMLQAKAMFPTAIKDYVDWEQVEQLGSVHKYPKEIKLMNETVKLTPEQKAAKIAEAKKKAVAEAKKKAVAEQLAIAKAKQEMEAKEFAENHFEVMPGQFVKKIKMARAA